jgi:hypothetical protein
MCDIVRVDRSSGTVAALLLHGVRSPRIVACSLHISGRSTPYYRCPITSISCTHLMPAIRCVWPITYAFIALAAPRAWRGHDGPGVRRLGNARVRLGVESHWACGGYGALPHQEAGTEAFSYQVTGSVPRGTWQHRSPLLVSGAHGALGYVVTLEPFPGGWHALCRGASGDTGALFWRVAWSVPRGTWRSQSLLAPGTDLEPRG